MLGQTFTGLLLVAVPALMLLAAGTLHVVAPGHLAEALTRTQSLPAVRRSVALTARTWGGAEVAVGAMLLAGATIEPGLLDPAVTAAAGMYLLFTLWLVRSVVRGTGTPCGCTGRRTPASGVTIARSSVLGVGVLVGHLVLDAQAVQVADIGLRDLSLVAIAAASFAIIAWNLPDALMHPTAMQAARRFEPRTVRA